MRVRVEWAAFAFTLAASFVCHEKLRMPQDVAVVKLPQQQAGVQLQLGRSWEGGGVVGCEWGKRCKNTLGLTKFHKLITLWQRERVRESKMHTQLPKYCAYAACTATD